jgi:DNA-binding response OmpR family regulator
MRKVLVVEDERVLLNVLKEKLEDDGWDVDTALDGVKAISKIKKGGYDLILLDIMLPKKNGFEVLKFIKKEAVSDVPVIILSNLGSDEDIKKAMSLGATDYFVKAQHPIGEIVDKAAKYKLSDKGSRKSLSEKEEETVADIEKEKK